jgi:hypothetical protein
MIQEYQAGTHPCNPDTDSDGLEDGFEISIQTNPIYWDSDGDVLPDGFEYSVGLNPLSNDSDSDGILDSLEDLDFDGLTNIKELAYDTDANLWDSDGDGVPDGIEASQGSDPNNISDGGVAPPAEDIIELTLTVGDWSGSNSERWILHVGSISHQAPDFGVVYSDTYIFRRGEEYQITVEHVGSDPEYCAENSCPDLDYEANVSVLAGSNDVISIYDPNSLLGQYNDKNPAGLIAMLYIPKLEIDTPNEGDDFDFIASNNYLCHNNIMFSANILPENAPFSAQINWSLELVDPESGESNNKTLIHLFKPLPMVVVR